MKAHETGWSVYLLECADATWYCGVTTDITRRLEQHNRGKGSKYVRSRLPAKLVDTRCGLTKTAAMQLEYRIKQMSNHYGKLLLLHGSE
jgi:putative endonuclease